MGVIFKQRIKKGGHAVPEKDIRRRFNSSLNHFFRFYLPLVDEALLCDAEAKPILIAHFKQNQWDILNKKTYDLVQKQITS